MEIEISTHDTFLVFDILGKSSASAGDIIDVPGGAKLKYNGALICKSFGIPETYSFLLTFGSSVAASVLANWIYEKLKDRAKSVSINRRTIKLDKGEIQKIIEESIKIEK